MSFNKMSIMSALSALSALSVLPLFFARVTLFPACETAGLHGALDKTVLTDFRAGECYALVSHKYKAIYLTPARFPKVMRQVTDAFCEGYQCHPDELTRYNAVRGPTMAKYFVFTFVKNPWMRVLKSGMAERAHATCALGRVDYVGRVEHAAADWDKMMDIKNGVIPMDIPDSAADNDGCENFPLGFEFAVNNWYDDDIRAYQFPRPVDLGKIFYSGTLKK